MMKAKFLILSLFLVAHNVSFAEVHIVNKTGVAGFPQIAEVNGPIMRKDTEIYWPSDGCIGTGFIRWKSLSSLSGLCYCYSLNDHRKLMFNIQKYNGDLVLITFYPGNICSCIGSACDVWHF